MDTLLKILGGTLGLVVPWLFSFILGIGIDRSPLVEQRKASSRRALRVVIAAWTAAVWAASLTGAISFHEGDAIPRVLIPLGLPVVLGVLALASADFRSILDHTPLHALVAAQTFRFAGATFLLVVSLGVLPDAFASGGYGDLATASLAVVAALGLSRGKSVGAMVAFWAFTLAGLGDLLNVAVRILGYYPIWFRATPSSAPMADFALVMVPAIAAPCALLLHIYALRAVFLGHVVTPKSAAA
jgi:hypothetical protein